jgi:hypothetical protein
VFSRLFAQATERGLEFGAEDGGAVASADRHVSALGTDQRPQLCRVKLGGGLERRQHCWPARGEQIRVIKAQAQTEPREPVAFESLRA